jgi:hypothetical protein
MKLLSALVIWTFLILVLSSIGSWVFGFASAFVIVPIFQIPLRRAVILGFCAGFLSWLAAAWFMDYANLRQLSGMITSLLQIRHPIIILGITGVLGGLGVTLAAWLAVSLFIPKSSEKVVS